MSTTALLPPRSAQCVAPNLSDCAVVSFYRFSVDKYHRMIESGLLTEDDNVELLDGYLVEKMSKNPPHEGTLHRLNYFLQRALPVDWQARIQMSITLDRSEPEPDAAIVRGTVRTYDLRHPSSCDFGIVIEVSDTTLDSDRADKARRYARSNIPEYWIVNIPDLQIEVYTSPQPAAAEPHYAVRTDYRAGASVPVVLDGRSVAAIPVADILP